MLNIFPSLFAGIFMFKLDSIKKRSEEHYYLNILKKFSNTDFCAIDNH